MIHFFDGEFAFLSNFFQNPITYNGQVWYTAENLFQAQKTLNYNEKEQIRLAETPGKAKRMGGKVTLRSDWEERKKEIILKVVRLKFNQNQELFHRLLATGEEELIEGNTWHDNTWGKCSCPKCQHIPGQNLLGKILMQVRKEMVEQRIGLDQESQSLLENNVPQEVV